MNVSVTREGNDAALKIAVTAAEVDKSFKQAVARIANQVRIPGFRPGKAPRNIIEMHYGKAAVKEEAFNICVNRAYQQAIETEKLMPVSRMRKRPLKSLPKARILKLTLRLY